MSVQQLARELRKNATGAELILWRHLRMRQMGGFKFRRQYMIGGKYILDFICLEAKLVIEIDGGQHNEEKNIQADLIRSAWLEKQGLKILRFWNNEVLRNLAEVKEVIWRELGLNNPHPGPPPEKRGRE